MTKILFFIGAALIFIFEILGAVEVVNAGDAKAIIFIGFLLMIPGALKLSFTDKL